MGQERYHHAFKFTHAVGDIGGDVVQYLAIDVQSVLSGFHGQELAPQLVVGFLELHCHAPLEARYEPGLHSVKVTGTAIT